MSNKLEAGLFCLEGYWTVCGLIGDILSVIAAILSIILYLPLLPFACIVEAICTSKDPEKNERESREEFDAYFDRLDKDVDLRL